MKLSPRAFAALLATVFLASHLPFLPASLEDLDSINFALGLHDFNVARHQPHPPGYPVFIAVSKLVWTFVASEAHALAAVSIVAGALSAWPIAELGNRMLRGGAGSLGPMAALLVMAAPLFWITASRPLSDMAGLLAAVTAQALSVGRANDRRLIAAGAIAGLGAGIRSQVVWLTLPLLCFEAARSRAQVRLRVLSAYLAGVAVWFVPLVVAAGGPGPYWNALSAQGSEDFHDVVMLSTAPGIRQLAWALRDTFLTPWASWSIAAVVLTLAAMGLVRLLLVGRRAVFTVAIAFGPYLLFHLLFHETITTRYALPLVVPVVLLAVCGIELAGRRAATALAALLAAICLAAAQPVLVAYSRSQAPGFKMLADMQALSRNAEPPVVAMHRDLLRPVTWVGDSFLLGRDRLPSPPRHEWLEVVKYWNGGGRKPVWFVADPLRSDLALVHHGDPRGSYRWPLRDVGLLGGARPTAMDWFVFEQPAWYLGEGWALTPETAGVAFADAKGPGLGGIEGWVRRTDGPASLVIGGRHLEDGAPPAQVSVALDGRTIETLTTPPGFFVRVLTLPAGSLAGQGDYARLTVTASHPRLAIEQFDLQPSGRPVFALGEGWYEHEYNPSTGERWRWTSERAVVRVKPEGHDMILAIVGEGNPSAASPRVTIRAGPHVVVDEQVEGAFSIQARIPVRMLAGPEAELAIETDQIYVPADERWRSSDRRRLGLRISGFSLRPAS